MNASVATVIKQEETPPTEIFKVDDEEVDGSRLESRLVLEDSPKGQQKAFLGTHSGEMSRQKSLNHRSKSSNMGRKKKVNLAQNFDPSQALATVQMNTTSGQAGPKGGVFPQANQAEENSIVSTRAKRERKIPIKNAAHKPEMNIAVDDVEEDEANAASNTQLSQKKYVAKSKPSDGSPPSR